MDVLLSIFALEFKDYSLKELNIVEKFILEGWVNFAEPGRIKLQEIIVFDSWIQLSFLAEADYELELSSTDLLHLIKTGKLEVINSE